MEIITLHHKGLKQRAIARKLGISRNTVKKYLEDPGLTLGPSPPRNRKSMLDPYSENIKVWIENIKYLSPFLYVN